MSILAERGRLGFPRALVTSLLDTCPSPMALLALAGLPALVAAWALMSPPRVLSNMETWDLLFNLAGAWHVYLGHVAHIDFHEPVGQLNFMLTAIGFHLLGPDPSAFLVNVAIVTAFLFTASFLAAWRRLPLLPAAVFVVFICLLALLPADLGGHPNQYSFAMSYNRYCWGAFSILGLILFVPPRNQRGGDWVDMAIVGLLLLAMFYLKITYFAVGLAGVAFAIVFHPHVRRQWLGWCVVGAIVVANALAPYNHPYLIDILASAQGGAVRGALSPHLNRFFAAVDEYSPYAAALVVACWMWLAGHAPLRFPLTIAFLLATGLVLLSQNTQAAGMPSTIVIIFILYDWLRTHFDGARARDVAPLLLALLVLPLFTMSAFASSLAGYHLKASRAQTLYVVEETNLRGLAVPAGVRGSFATYARGDMDYPLRDGVDAAQPRYDISQHEYVATLMEAARLLSGHQPGGIALFDQVNPLPYMLGLPPSRGANLWSTWITSIRPADEYLANIRYVLVPKFPINADWTAALKGRYSDYLTKHFERAADAPSWVLLVRTPQQGPPANR